MEKEMLIDPTLVSYTNKNISRNFYCGRDIFNVQNEIKMSKWKIRDIPLIRIFKYKGDFFTDNNRRLAVFHMLYACGTIRRIKVIKVQKCHVKKNLTFTTSIKIRNSTNIQYIHGGIKSTLCLESFLENECCSSSDSDDNSDEEYYHYDDSCDSYDDASDEEEWEILNLFDNLIEMPCGIFGSYSDAHDKVKTIMDVYGLIYDEDGFATGKLIFKKLMSN